MTYGKTARPTGILSKYSLSLWYQFIENRTNLDSRATFIPEKYWPPAKPTVNRHDFFFKPQQEDLAENNPRPR